MNPSLQCDFGSLGEYSAICHADDPPEKCYSESYYELRIATTVWAIANGSIGVLGNLFTLLAIPYAKHRQR
jgi:hypothetical protein